MGQGDISLEMEGMRIQVKGLSETLAKLSAVGEASQDMKDLMHSTGEIIAARARTLVPVKSTALQKSIRAGRGKTKAVVRAGTAARVPYAGVRHYGNPYTGLDPSMFMVQALQDRKDEALAHIERGLSELLKKHGLY